MNIFRLCENVVIFRRAESIFFLRSATANWINYGEKFRMLSDLHNNNNITAQWNLCKWQDHQVLYYFQATITDFSTCYNMHWIAAPTPMNTKIGESCQLLCLTKEQRPAMETHAICPCGGGSGVLKWTARPQRRQRGGQCNQMLWQWPALKSTSTSTSFLLLLQLTL